MASASEDDYSDDYDSAEENSQSEEVESPKVKSPRNTKSVSIKVPSTKSPRKSGRRSTGSPVRSRPSSSAGTFSAFAARKSVQELWQKKSMKNGGTSTGTKKGLKSRSAVEAWGDHLRRSGSGISTESKNNTMTGLNKSKAKDMSYASTSHYLRQLMGAEKGRRVESAPVRAAPGTPAYKSPEEYYDEIMELKKTLAGMSVEQSSMKSKLRRLEEDNLKKEKEIQNLLDPSKSDEMRRTLADGKSDSSSVIHSLKQKILKLEQGLREKESQYAKLQTDLKTTRVEEMKMQLETCYKEILRLSTLKQAGALSARQSAREEKAAGPKMRALQETVLRMNEKNVRLQQENKTLKEDLEKMMEESAQNKAKNVEYEDMSKKQLMWALSKLEKRLDKADADNTSLMSDIDDRRGRSEGKIPLEGTMAQKLNQLDKRETELLDEIEKQKGVLKKLKEDRIFYRKKNEEKDKEVKRLKLEMEELQAELDDFYNKDKSRTPRPSSRRSSMKSSPPRSRRGSRSRSPSVASELGHKRVDRERSKRAEILRENNAAKKIQRGWRSHKTHEQDERRRQVKAMALRERHAAVVIQKGWKDYQHRKDEQENEATELIQSAMRGHLSRKQNLSYLSSRSRGYHADMNEDSDSELDSAAEYIQSNVRGYKYHKEHISRSHKELLHDGEYDSDILEIQAAFRGHLARKNELRNAQKPPKPYTYRSPNISRKMSTSRSRLDSAGEEEDDEVSRYSARGKRRSTGGSPRGSLRGKSPSTYSNRSSRRTPTRSQHSDDDDDDIVDSRRRGSGKYY